MNSKRPFRLTLKTKSTTTESKSATKSSSSSKNASYVHPLAGQQDLLRKQYSSQPEAGPSRSTSNSNTNVTNEKAESDVETMSAAEGWFSSLDGESLRSSSPSPTEADLEGQTSLFDSVQEIFLQQQQRQESDKSSSGFSVIRQPNQPKSSSLSAEKKQADLVQMYQDSQAAFTAPIREGGILNRLKRISKKEKGRAVEESALDLHSVLLQPAPPSDVDMLRNISSSSSQPALARGDLSGDVLESNSLNLRDTATEKTPQLERSQQSRIHSIQPSLVDEESIAGRDSRSESPLEFDEDELEQRLTMGRSEVDDIQSQYGELGYMSEEGEGKGGKEVAEWQLENVPGSFFGNRIASREATTHYSDAGSEYQDAVNSEDSDDFASSSNEPMSHTPEINLHEAESSEYAQALSRQPSSYASYTEDDEVPTASLSDQQQREQDEEGEEAETPRANADEGRTSYFDTAALGALPSSAGRSITSSVSPSTPTKTTPLQPRKTYSWYQDAALSPQQRHSFLRHVIARELVWESERLFMLSSSASLFQPSEKGMLPRNDLAFFKPEAKGSVPDLPLIRFLYTHILSTCPLFGPTQPIEGAAAVRARKAGAKKFVDEALLPVLQFRQKYGLGHAVDINGEWPQETFDSPSTIGVMFGSLFKGVSRIVMASISDKTSQAWKWSDVASPSPAAYLSHRVSLGMLKQGGMEVNIVGARYNATSKECELLLSVKRFGFPPSLVVRTESDFYEYARGLAEELGRRGRIRPVPPPFGAEITDVPSRSSEEDTSVGGEEWNTMRSTSTNNKKGANREQMYFKGNSSQLSLQSLPARPPRQKPFRMASSESVPKAMASTRSSESIGSNNSPRLSNEVQSPQLSLGLSQQQSNQTTSPKPSVLERSRFFYRNKEVGSTELNSSQTSLGNGNSILSPSLSSAPIAKDEELRRKQLRAWLRDALSVRGAGHAKETMAFLNNGSFLEKELRAATKKDVAYRMEIDAQSIKEREKSAANAQEEILELRKEMLDLWRECVEGNRLVEAFEAVKEHDTFSSLPLSYQRVISWTNFKIAQFLHHVFLNSHEGRSNFDRMTELMQCIPWKALSLALREPTGLMIQRIKSSLTEEFVLKKILALQLEDMPTKKLELEISTLRKRLGSTIIRKLQGYVESSEWQKRLIRKASKQNEIPLVAAIVRGSDKPLLAAEGIKRIVSATKVYQDFLNTLPTYEEQRAKQKANVDVRLISDMQKALRLLSLKQNGANIRRGLKEELKGPIEAFLEPLFSLLKRLHRSKVLMPSKGSNKDVVMEMQEFVFKLMDVLAGLKMRIQDPWRSLSTLTLFLDDAVPSWYQFLHRLANVDSILLDLTIWFKGIANLFKRENLLSMEEMTKNWQPPKDCLNQLDRKVILELTMAAKRKRNHQMEAACRWAAGDTDADHSIQLMGEGGKTRVTPYSMASMPAISSKADIGLQVYLAGLRGSLSNLMM